MPFLVCNLNLLTFDKHLLGINYKPDNELYAETVNKTSKDPDLCIRQMLNNSTQINYVVIILVSSRKELYRVL